MNKQIHAYFSGRVQGVGFRYTCESIAINLGVGGWVRNLSDGRVEMLAQAQEEILLEFLSRIDKYFSDYLKDKDIEWQEVSSELKDFQIKFEWE